MQVILHLRPVGKGEAHALEDIDNLILHDGERVTGTKCHRIWCTCEVYTLCVRLSLLCVLFEGFYLLDSQLFQLINLYADLFLHVGRNIPELCHEHSDLTFLAEVFLV